jgi:hypothetical protein
MEVAEGAPDSARFWRSFCLAASLALPDCE